MCGHVITKFSRMGSLPHFLTHGVPLRVLRARELRYYCATLSIQPKKCYHIYALILKKTLKLYSCARTNSKISLYPSLETSCCNYKHTKIITIFKWEDEFKPNIYTSIAFHFSFNHTFKKPYLIYSRLKSFLDKHNVLYQFPRCGFRERSSTQKMHSLTLLI